MVRRLLNQLEHEVLSSLLHIFAVCKDINFPVAVIRPYESVGANVPDGFAPIDKRFAASFGTDNIGVRICMNTSAMAAGSAGCTVFAEHKHSNIFSKSFFPVPLSPKSKKREVAGRCVSWH